VIELVEIMDNISSGIAGFPESQRSKLVQAGKITSANLVSPSIQIDWFTTNSNWSTVSLDETIGIVLGSDKDPPYL
jgi:hypothetical protein